LLVRSFDAKLMLSRPVSVRPHTKYGEDILNQGGDITTSRCSRQLSWTSWGCNISALVQDIFTIFGMWADRYWPTQHKLGIKWTNQQRYV